MDHFTKPIIEVICYTAGLFDGEGSVYWTEDGNRFGCSITQSEVNDGEALVRWLRDQWGIGRCNPQNKTFRGRVYKQWYWSVNAAREIEFLLEACLPYLHVKHHQAELALIHLRQYASRTGRSKWSPGEEQYIRDHWLEHDAAIGAAIGRTATAVRRHRDLLGVASNHRGGGIYDLWTLDEDHYLQEHWREYDRQIAAALNKPFRAIRGRRERLGLPTKPRGGDLENKLARPYGETGEYPNGVYGAATKCSNGATKG